MVSFHVRKYLVAHWQQISNHSQLNRLECCLVHFFFTFFFTFPNCAACFTYKDDFETRSGIVTLAKSRVVSGEVGGGGGCENPGRGEGWLQETIPNATVTVRMILHYSGQRCGPL